jgi:3-dehydroquinate synthase
MKTVPVSLGARSYEIRIGRGLVNTAGEVIAAIRPEARAAIVTDANVGALHGAALEASLRRVGIDAGTITIPAGEGSKSFAALASLVDELIAARLERGDVVVAFGGGVVGDLAGFAASICRRGMDFVQIPTSLLAQVDSSVGGKTGINTRQGKNLAGAFHQPALVLADTALLETLPPREFRAGYAEVAKYGLIDNPRLFAWLEENQAAIFAREPALEEAIAASCHAKAKIVAADESEAGVRALLNLGHTFGHALEAACGYDGARLIHGEAVAIGIILAHEFSNRLELCDAGTVRRVTRHFNECGLPTRLADIPGKLPDASRLADHFFQDKKVRKGQLTMILTKGIGMAYIAGNVPRDIVEKFLREKLPA